MWYKLNESIGIVLLIAVVGGGAVYGLYKLVSGPPLLRQEGQEVDPRTNPYARQMMAEHDKAMRRIHQYQEQVFQDAMDTRERALGR